jgi:hypothetical protein
MEQQLELRDFEMIDSNIFISCEADAIAAGLCCECCQDEIFQN